MSELEDREWKSLMLKRKKKKGDDDSLRDLWDNIKCTNSILGAPEGKEKERKGQRAYLGRKTRDPTSRKHRATHRISLKRSASRYIIIKMTKIKHKDRILKATREKQQRTYRGHVYNSHKADS